MLRVACTSLQQLAAAHATSSSMWLAGHGSHGSSSLSILRAYAKIPSYPSPPASQDPTPSEGPRANIVDKHVIYKGKWIIPVRFLVRGKVFQFMGMLGVASAAFSMRLDEATTGDMLALGGLAAGVVIASNALWYYSRRYVGEMSLLLPDKTHVRFSTVDFWGNREDNDVPLTSIEPPFKGVRPSVIKRLSSQVLFPVNVKGDRQYYLSFPAGKIYDQEAFLKILHGDPL